MNCFTMMRTERTSEDTMQEAIVKTLYAVINSLIAAGICRIIGALARVLNLTTIDLSTKTCVVIGFVIVVADFIRVTLKEMKAEMAERVAEAK